MFNIPTSGQTFSVWFWTFTRINSSSSDKRFATRSIICLEWFHKLLIQPRSFLISTLTVKGTKLSLQVHQKKQLQWFINCLITRTTMVHGQNAQQQLSYPSAQKDNAMGQSNKGLHCKPASAHNTPNCKNNYPTLFLTGAVHNSIHLVNVLPHTFFLASSSSRCFWKGVFFRIIENDVIFSIVPVCRY